MFTVPWFGCCHHCHPSPSLRYTGDHDPPSPTTSTSETLWISNSIVGCKLQCIASHASYRNAYNQSINQSLSHSVSLLLCWPVCRAMVALHCYIPFLNPPLPEVRTLAGWCSFLSPPTNYYCRSATANLFLSLFSNSHLYPTFMSHVLNVAFCRALVL